MDYNGFLNWLLKDRNMSERSARDVVSRLKRCLLIMEVDMLPNNGVERLLNSKNYTTCSMSVKSQLKRAIMLYDEYAK